MPGEKKETSDEVERSTWTDLRLRTSVLLGAAVLGGAATANNHPAEAADKPAAVSEIASSQNKVAEPLAHFGYDTNEVWVEDPDQALEAAQAVANAGGDTIRILTWYNAGSVEVNNDLTRYCNALVATDKYGLRLEIGLDGRFKNGNLGYFPTHANEMQKLHTELFNLMSHLSGGSCHDEAGNPINAKEIDLDFNEPNYKQRYKQAHMGQNLANLLVYMAPLLRQDADKLHIRFNLTAAAVTLSEPNDPFTFIEELDNQLNRLMKPGDPLPFDGFAFNNYAFGQFTADNLDSASPTIGIERAVDEVRSDFGKDLPINISELGAFSDTPADKESLYSHPVPATVKTFQGNKQGHFYERVIDLAACLNLDGVQIFHQFDDGNDVLRTGDHYPNGDAKPSARIIAKTLAKLRAGSVNC